MRGVRGNFFEDRHLLESPRLWRVEASRLLRMTLEFVRGFFAFLFEGVAALNLVQSHGPQTQSIGDDRNGTETHGGGSDHRVEKKVM